LLNDRRSVSSFDGKTAGSVSQKAHRNTFMTDVFSKKRRSEIMRKIGPKNTAPEKRVRSLIHGMGYRFRLHRKDLPGRPDLVFPKYHKGIFVHGCFWHGGHRGCRRSSIPGTNRAFWKKKIEGNMRRDRINYRKLKRLGWQYLVIWQCEIKKTREMRLKRQIGTFLRG